MSENKLDSKTNINCDIDPHVLIDFQAKYLKQSFLFPESCTKKAVFTSRKAANKHDVWEKSLRLLK